MGVIYLLLKIFPIFGLAVVFISVDLTRNFRRKGNPVWVGTLLLGLVFFIFTVLWVVYRGDQNADHWYQIVKTSFFSS